MIHIAGGAYVEFCQEPHWNQFFGSGLRAAAALQELADEVTLHTYVAQNYEDELNSMANSFNVTLATTRISETVRFNYYHPLAVPKIIPSPGSIKKVAPLSVSGDMVLRYGFMEGSAIVKGDYVTYDPQSTYDPRPFHENGSTANHLALVLNRNEGEKLSKEAIPINICRKLLERPNMDVVVLKMGAFGALVATPEKSETIPAYATKDVWPIGSGDIFAALFAYYWGEKKIDPLTSAQKASYATAYYCNFKSLPIPKEIPEFNASPITASPEAFERQKKVYLASPFFCMQERWIVHETRSMLIEHGLDVFSPFHDVGHGFATHVVPEDIQGIKDCFQIVALIDGLDSGTLFEVGYARALNKPVVALCQKELGEAIKMLEGTQCTITDDFSSLIYKALWNAAKA